MSTQVLELSTLKRLLPMRHVDAHKQDFGHVLILGGSIGMSGAARMAAEAALRAGAGMVTVATHPDHAAYINIGRPEIMAYGIENPTKQLPLLLKKASVLVIGPGLSDDAWSQQLTHAIASSTLPKVIDAGALDRINDFDLTHTVCTPHPGEAARILQVTPQKIQQDRLSAIKQLTQHYSATWVLKGHQTLIETKTQLMQCPYGNPGMASAGMGDVLSGVIGALLAQHLTPHDAACLGVAVHAYAGDLIAQQKGQRGLLATDLFEEIRTLLN